MPRYRIADWAPDFPLTEEEWLARWAAAGWRPEHEAGGTWTTVNGHKLKRFAMVQEEPPSEQR